MRRTFFMLAAALLAAVPSAVAGAGGAERSPSAAGPSAAAGGGSADTVAAFGAGLISGKKLTFPIPDAPGPATLSPSVQALVEGASPSRLLDLVVTLDRPADSKMAAALSRLGVWTHTFAQLPSAGIRIPVARLAELRNLRGVLAVYDNHTWRLPSIATHAYYVIFECERIGGELTPSIETSDFRWVGLDDLDGLTLYKTHLHKVPNVLRLYAERAPADYH